MPTLETFFRRAGALGTMCIMLHGFSASAQPAAPADSATLAYGRHLAKSCAPCHQIATGFRTGNFAGARRIAGLEPSAFLSKLAEKEISGDPAMQAVAAGLTEEDRLALAAYLSLIILE